MEPKLKGKYFPLPRILEGKCPKAESSEAHLKNYEKLTTF